MLEKFLPLLWIPFVTAFIGWVTNWIAIKMLFHPKKKISFAGWKLQGLIPRRQQDLAEKTAEIIERELLSQHTISQQIEKIDLEPHLEEFAQKLVQERLGERLKAIPMVGAFINESALDKLAQIALEEMKKQAGPLQEKVAAQVESHLQVRQLIEQKIAELNLDKLEEIVLHVAHKELRTIEWLGAVLGFLIGCGQVVILALYRWCLLFRR